MGQQESEIIKSIDKYITNSNDIDISYYDSMLTRYPSSSYLIGMKAYNLILSDKLKEASLFLDEKIIENPRLLEDSYILMTKGILAKKQENLTIAMDFFKKGLSSDIRKDNKWLRLELFYHYREKDEEKAWKFLEDAISIDPEFTTALIAKSYMLDQVENCEEIVSLLEKVVKNYQDHEVYSYLGNAYYNCHNKEKGEIFFQKSLTLQPNADAFLGLAHIEHYEKNNLEKALNYYQQSLKLDSSNPIVLNAIGWLYFDIKAYEKAEEAFMKLINLDSSQEPYNQLILFHLLKKDIKKAETLNRKAEEINKRSFFNEGFDLIIQIMDSSDWDNDYSKAIKVFESKYGEVEINWFNQTLNALIENR